MGGSSPDPLQPLRPPRFDLVRDYWDSFWGSKVFGSDEPRRLAWAWTTALAGGFGELQAYELAKLLPENPNALEKMLNAEGLDVATRAKILEVVLDRGGSYSIEHLRLMVATGVGPLEKFEALERISYQEMAMKTVLTGEHGAEMFKEISRSGDALPTGRLPATQFMHDMLQEGGLMGGFEGQEVIERWIKGEPNAAEVEQGIKGVKDPETAGRAMRHVFDAAYRKDAGGGYVLSGYVEFSAGPVTFGVSSGTSNGNHWDDTVANISPGVGKWFGEQSEADKRAIAQGYLGSDYSFDKSAGSSAKP